MSHAFNSPDTEMTPSFTVVVTVGKSFVASFTLFIKESSAVITTGAGGGGAAIATLFSTDFTPLTAVANSDAFAFAASSFVSPADSSYAILNINH